MSTKEERRFYTSARWRAVREKALDRDGGLCVRCRIYGRVTEAREVDHIEPLKDRPDLALVLSNLQTLCRTCHRRKTLEDSRPDLGICNHGHARWACNICERGK